MDVSLPECSWSHQLAPRSLVTLRGVAAAARDNLEQYRASRMSGIESAASMFLRSGGMTVAAAADAGPWGYAAQHCSSCDLGPADLQTAQGECWSGEGADMRFRSNCNGKSAFRANVQPLGRRDEVSGHGFLAAAPGRGLNCGYLVPAHAAENGAGGGLGLCQKPAEVDAMKSYTVQDLIRALQMGGSRSKMEAAITVRSLAASNNAHQVALIAAGGIRPLVELLSYEAGETHWPPEMREKATITVRAEAALALASLSVSNDDNKGAIGAAGAIPLLCGLIQFDEESYNSALASYENQEMAPFLVLARDAGAGALSCLAKNENNKEAIFAAQAVPVLVRMVDRGTSFGRAAAANVLAKLATGSNAQNKLILGKEGAISALIRLLKDGSQKARETAAEALFNLAMSPWNKSKIIQEGGMSALLRMLEAGSQAEKDAATAALKILRSSVGSPSNLRPSGGPRCKRSEGNPVQELELETCDGSQQRREVLKDLNEHIQSSNEKSSMPHNAGNISVLKPFSALSTTVAAMQSELTSSIAPPLTGQPSMQADAAVDLPKSSSHMMQSRKKLKLSHSDIGFQNSDKSRAFGDGLGRAMDKAAQKVEPLLMPYLDERGTRNTPCGWERNSITGQGFQSPPYQEGPQPRLRQPKLAVDGAAHPVAGGILALVNALSSQNPGAQEFAALALMLLATQGGDEVKTAIADAGAIEPLISMVGSSGSPLIRESAAAAIAKLVSGHPGNRAAVVRNGGVKAMVEMAKWSSTLVDGPSGGGSLGARTQAAAIVAVLNISEVLDRHSVGMVLRDAVPCLAQLLESEHVLEITAGVAGLQILGVSLGIRLDIPLMETENGASKFDFVAFEMVSALLDVMRGGSAEAQQSATEALAGLGSGLGWDSPDSPERPAAETWRRCGIEALLLLLRNGPGTVTLMEVVAGTVACVVASPILCHYVHEAAVVPDLMRIVQEGQTTATRILAAAAVANLGSRKKRLDTISDKDIAILLKILGGDFELPESTAATVGADNIASVQCSDSQLYLRLQQRSMPYMLLCEHASAILVYATLSGDKKKQVIIDLEAAPILVRALQNCVSVAESSVHLTILQGGSRPINPVFRHATQEFAMMGLILLANKSIDTMEKIVRAGGIPTLVSLLGATDGRGKLGASWSEMAAAALLTMAGCEAAREEIIRARGIPSLVQVLKGEGGTSFLSLTGLAAMAQLLGVLALKSQEAKLLMAKAGAVRCLVEILVGGGCLAWAADAECCPAECPGLLALAQEAAAAALATMVLRCAENAEAAVEAGAIGPLVRLLSVPSSSARPSSVLALAPAVDRGDSGASSGETGITQDTKTTVKTASTLDSHRKTSKLTTCNDQDLGENRTGGSMAAMAALGNMISCFPQCKREVIGAGVISKLASLLQPKAASPSNGEDDSAAEPSPGCCLQGPTKLQESAALVLGLLAESDADLQETIQSGGVISTAATDTKMPNNNGSASEAPTEVADDVEDLEKKQESDQETQGSADCCQTPADSVQAV